MLSTSQTGFYGKLSSQGDFVLRRLPQQFVAPWDAWLQSGIAESKLTLGGAWEENYRNAPVWRFLLAPGICGEPAWAGLLQPSVDRVGRHFPLTVAAALPNDINVLETMLNASSWYADIERETAAAFSADVQIGALDSQLEQLVFPERFLVRADDSEDTLPGVDRSFAAIKIAVRETSAYQAIRSTLIKEQVVVGLSDCVWSDMTSGQESAALLLTKGLPSAARFCAMLDAQWENHGWELASCNDSAN